MARMTVRCEDVFKKMSFELPFDYLVIATGCKTNTFNTPGVNEGMHGVFFLKHLHHARQIRNRILECFERAALPGISEEERDRLLSFVVVGGGPTSCGGRGVFTPQHDYPTTPTFLSSSPTSPVSPLLHHYQHPPHTHTHALQSS